jgi:elongation factor G
MRKYATKDIRNVGFVGHGGSGKTALAAAILFDTKAVTRIDRGIFDYEPEEVDRESSISATLARAQWNKKRLTLIDTPGDSNFIADSLNCMTVMDTVVVVVSAVGHVEVQTERVWNFAEERGIPRLVFINHLDRDRASFDDAIASVHEVLHTKGKIAPLVLPIGSEKEFKGVVDLLASKAYQYETDGSGTFKEIPIPADLASQAAEVRSSLLDDIVESDEALMEKYLGEGGESLSEDEIFGAMTKAIASGALVPVLCGSATANVGVFQLLDVLTKACPSPADRPALKASRDGVEVEVSADENAPFAGQVFKTIYDQYSGKINLFRVWAGSLSADSGFYNVTRGVKERFGQLLFRQGRESESAGEAGPGDIVAVAKLKDTTTGDTLFADEKSAAVLPPLPQINPVIGYAVKPRTKADEDKIGTALGRLCEADPTLRIERDTEAKEIILQGMGQVHIKVNVDRLARMGVLVDLAEPKVPYRETIKGKVMNVEGKHKKQTGGRGQFGVCYINLEPLPRGTGFEFVDAIVGGSIPRQYIPSVEKGVINRMGRGIIAGFPVVDLRVTVFDGKYHDVDSSDMAFQLAGSKGLMAAFRDPKARPILLEPIWTLEVVCPEENGGDIMGDVSRRRGKVLGMESKGRNQVVKATVPFSELLDYAPALDSMTGGRGSFTMAFHSYDELPSHLAEKIIANRKIEVEEE